MLEWLTRGGGAGMRGCGLTAHPAAGLAVIIVIDIIDIINIINIIVIVANLAVNFASPSASAASAPPTALSVRASQPRGGGAVDAAAGATLGLCGDGRVGGRRAAALAATATVIVRRRGRLQAV